MPADAITPSQFKSAMPQFASVDDAVVQSYIDLAQIWVNEDWVDPISMHAQMAVTCHLMTLDGLGSDARSRDFLSGRGEFQSVKSGNVTLTRFRSSAEGAGVSTGDWFSQTPCGRKFMVFVRMFSGGPVWASGSVGGQVSGYAKDQFRDGWWM